MLTSVNVFWCGTMQLHYLQALVFAKFWLAKNKFGLGYLTAHVKYKHAIYSLP